MGAKPRAAASRVGQLYAVPVRRGRWTACQIVWESDRAVEVIELDWLDARRPTAADLAGREIRGRFQISETAVPKRFVAIGAAPAPVFDERSNSYSGWWSIPVSALGRARRAAWPPEVREAIAAVTRDEISLAFGGPEPLVTRHDSWRLSVAGDEVRWSALDALPALSTLTYEGADPGVIAYVRSRPTIIKLLWSGSRLREIDVRGAGLSELRLAPATPISRLAIDDDLQVLALPHEAGAGLTIDHARRGRELELQLWSDPAKTPVFPAGLERLGALRLSNLRRVDVEPISRFGGLETLELNLDAGAIDNVGALAALAGLRRLVIRDGYDVDPEAMPVAAEAWPAIESALLFGLRKTAAPVLRRRLAAVPSLRISGAKSDAWIAKHARNPFRDWVDRDKRLGRAACKAYVTALGALDKARAAEGAWAALDAMVAGFNELDARYGLDTVDREEVAEAYFALGARAGLEGAQLERRFDGVREF